MQKIMDFERSEEYVGLGADVNPLDVLKNMAFAAGGAALSQFAQTPVGQQLVASTVKAGEEQGVLAVYEKVKANFIKNWKLYLLGTVGVGALVTIGVIGFIRSRRHS